MTYGKLEWLGTIRPDRTKEQEEATPGELGKIAIRVLMKILYGARMARFDLLKVTTSLAQKITKWTEECDKELHRLICYIASTPNLKMTGYMGNTFKDISLDLYGDADFAGCKETHRSTTGVFQCLSGSHTRFPLVGVAKRQNCVSHSTPEAEIVAFAYGIRMEGLPSMDLWKQILKYDLPLRFHEDNTATIRIVETGRSNNLRHLQRTHRVNFSWFAECRKRGLFTIQYCDTKSQAADIFTKSSHDANTWKHLLKLICHIRSGELKQLESYNKRGATEIDKSQNIVVSKKRKKQKRAKVNA